MKKVFFVLFLIIFLSSCAKFEPECVVDSDCETPMEFLIQSNCPFGSICYEGECAVVCPFTYHDTNPEVSKSYPVPCHFDFDCDCSDRTHSLDCVCHDNACLSIEG
ncbi:hypothetical protein GOV05_03025 [Candidatus Woesearchaeota archaeon]|nr:hypothetical protein [Candidatus Woesearchaeota archaeon]